MNAAALSFMALNQISTQRSPPNSGASSARGLRAESNWGIPVADQDDDPGSFSPARHLEPRGAPYVTAVRYLDAAWRGVAGPLGTLPPGPDRAVLSTILDELSGPLTSLLKIGRAHV